MKGPRAPSRSSLVRCSVAAVFACLLLLWGGLSEDDDSIRAAPRPLQTPLRTPDDHEATPAAASAASASAEQPPAPAAVERRDASVVAAEEAPVPAVGEAASDPTATEAPLPPLQPAATPTPTPPATPSPEWAWVADAATLNGSSNCAERRTAPSVSLDFYRKASAFRAFHKLHLATRDIVMRLAAVLPYLRPRGVSADVEALRELRKHRARTIKASTAILRPNPGSDVDAAASARGFRHGPWGNLFEAHVAVRKPVKRKVAGAPLRTMADATDRFQFELEQDVAAVLASFANAADRPPVKAVFDLGARTYNASLSTVEERISAYTSSLRVLEEHVPGFDAADVFAFELDQQYIGTFSAFAERRRERRATGAFRLYAAAAWANPDGIVMGGYSSMKSSADKCGKVGECVCFPSLDIPAMIERYPPRSVVLKMDIEGAEWVLVKAIIDRGVADRIAVLFLECHGQRSTSGIPSWTHDKDNWFKPPTLSPESKNAPPHLLQMQWWQSVSGLGAECYLMHDILRSHGIATYEWP